MLACTETSCLSLFESLRRSPLFLSLAHVPQKYMLPSAARGLSYGRLRNVLLRKLDVYHLSQDSREPLRNEEHHLPVRATANRARDGMVSADNDTDTASVRLDPRARLVEDRLTSESDNVLRWFEEHEAGRASNRRHVDNISSRKRLVSMVRAYTERETPIAYILGGFPFNRW